MYIKYLKKCLYLCFLVPTNCPDTGYEWGEWESTVIQSLYKRVYTRSRNCEAITADGDICYAENACDGVSADTVVHEIVDANSEQILSYKIKKNINTGSLRV